MRIAYLLLLASALGAAVSPEEYRGRREKLRAAVKGVVLLMGATEGDHGDLRAGFFQEANFYYLTGWTEPGAALLLTPDREAFFVPARNAEIEKWTGPKLGPDDAGVAQRTGAAEVLPATRMESEVRKELERFAGIYTMLDQPYADKVKALAPARTVGNVALDIAKLRMVKSEAELDLIRRATEASMEAHRVSWKRAAPGMYEYQVATAMASVYFDRGCQRHAYAPIVGSGPNAVTLHYSRNGRRMDRGELLLMDVGAECDYYAADITRTIPVGAKFTARQREIYELVLGAQKAAIAAVKPGMTLAKTGENSLYKIALEYFNKHGKDRAGQPIGKYFTHGLGHHVGLDVHDANDPSEPLRAGMVITIEPGLYLADENIGVRIEDMVLVTENGAKVLSAGLPREIADIERAIGK